MSALLAITLSVLLFLLPINSAYSAPLKDAPPVISGCEYQVIDINNPSYAGYPFANPQLIKAENGELQTTLKVAYSDRQIAGCQVHLRSYNGQLVGPTLRVKPGDTINLKLINDLPLVAFSIKQVPSGEYQFAVNDRAFSPQDERKLELNKAEIWQIRTDSTNITDKHPFHIHVNSFQYDRQDPNHQTERIWRDTLMVNADQPETIRTRYTEFPGKFVLHCHILDHEDQGMMQAVEIVRDSQNASLISAISQ